MDHKYIELNDISPKDNKNIDTNYEEHILMQNNPSAGEDINLSIDIPLDYIDENDIQETSSVSDFTPVLENHPHEPLLATKGNGKDSLENTNSPIAQQPKYKITFKSLFLLDYELTAEALPSLIISVIGLTISGWLLNIVMSWEVYEKISELIVLIPILLNLKGNLEMNLASRLSTESNLGHLDTYNMAKDIIVGNMIVLQAQAFIVGSISGLFAWFMGGMSNGEFIGLDKTIVLVISSIFSASICSLILGIMVSVIIVYSKKLKINPDNVATPLAASMGDLITLLVLSVCGDVLIRLQGTIFNDILLIVLFALIPYFCYLALKNIYVRDVLFAGWVPIISSLVITSIAGIVFEKYMDSYKGIAVIMPVLNGIAGNIGSLYVSRLSTDLHIGVVNNYVKTFVTLFWIHLPTEWSFLILIEVFNLGDTNVNILFIIVYTLMSVLLMTIILLFAHKATYWFWNHHFDPDNYCLPTLTALSDVLGTVLLVYQYYLLFIMGDKTNYIESSA
ncbi:MgtE-domain-containing protein [Piromyces finnis]|uniref:MgtE-domain-containing protein n=1 Tax=Piromyces finnis TaxID=1754191 RepID=A0A1Y1VDW5_9FUNG|nr:MgtE-domain-containing protein [Piromyces finnis]|eukprot:ORX53757.1 MgtE-domain-containing protein [Piromyces finnis]